MDDGDELEFFDVCRHGCTAEGTSDQAGFGFCLFCDVHGCKDYPTPIAGGFLCRPCGVQLGIALVRKAGEK